MIATGAALRLGFTQAFSRWATGLFAALASIAEVLAGATFTLGLFAWLDGGAGTMLVALGAGATAIFAARIMLTLVHGGAVRQSAAWLKGESTGSTLEEILNAAPHSLGWFAWTLPIEIVATAWKWLGIAALVAAYGKALALEHAGFPASASLALFVTASVPLAVLWAALRRASLVRAVAAREGPFAAASRAFAALLARPGPFGVVLFVGLVAAVGAEVVLSMFGSALRPDDLLAAEPMIAGELAVGVLIAFATALFELVILFGFTALESDPLAR